MAAREATQPPRDSSNILESYLCQQCYASKPWHPAVPFHAAYYTRLAPLNRLAATSCPPLARLSSAAGRDPSALNVLPFLSVYT